MTTKDPRAAATTLKEAMDLLARAGELLPRAAFLTRAAYDSADTALMIADNEMKLAERDAVTAKTYTLDEAHAHPGGIAALTGGAVTGPYFEVEGDDEETED